MILAMLIVLTIVSSILFFVAGVLEGILGFAVVMAGVVLAMFFTKIFWKAMLVIGLLLLIFGF